MSEFGKSLRNSEYKSAPNGGTFQRTSEGIHFPPDIVGPNKIFSTHLADEVSYGTPKDQAIALFSEKHDSQLRVANFRDLVEIGLQEHFGRNNSRYSEFAGSLSVHPEQVGKTVTPETLEFQCDDFSREFQRIEREAGLMTQLAVSDEGYNEHIYLVPDESYGLPDVIIDLTLGQYVRGHNHAFVGTREELMDIVVLQTGDGKPFTLEEPEGVLEPEEIALYMEPVTFFQRKWGETSIII